MELLLLRRAQERDIWLRKKKKGKMPKSKIKPDKPKKPPKPPKDPTGDRSTEDLFQELVDNGIIRTYPEAHLDEYIGDFGYKNWDLVNKGFNPESCVGDVRQNVFINCILPMSPQSMVRPKSVLIAGPRQSGKHLLANAVFTATRCVLFDLSCQIIYDKYMGKEIKMMMHLVNKMSRILQPSIIFIDGGEKPFYKSVPKPEKQFDPKRLGKELAKSIVKLILPEDRVMVLAISNQPFAGSPGGLNKAYEKIILVPRTDYGTVFMYWRELLRPYHGIDRRLNLSDLATLTVNYPLPQILAAVKTVMVPGRIVQFKYRPLQCGELLEAILSGPEPVTDAEWSKFTKWYSKTVKGAEMESLMEIEELRRIAEAEAAAKKKK